MTTLRRHSGRILYRRAGAVVGCEDFDIDVRREGRTVRAYCEMEEGSLTRDASWSLDAEHWPVEGHVRVVQNGRLIGSSWYHAAAGETQCEAFTADAGRRSLSLPGRARYLGLHPLIGDGLIALARGTDNPGETRAIASVTCSYDINGETELLALPISIDVTYIGTREVTIAAGSFAADAYELRWQPHWPPAKLLVHGADAVFMRLEWEFSGLTCELVQLDTSLDACAPRFLDVMDAAR